MKRLAAKTNAVEKMSEMAKMHCLSTLHKGVKRMKEVRYFFFRRNISKTEDHPEGSEIERLAFPSYQYTVIKPTLLNSGPGLSQNSISLLFWKLYAFVFLWKLRGKNFEVHLLHDGDKLVHFTVVLPKYFRFPFMADDDIECGPSWTDSQYRGKGLFPVILETICRRFAGIKANCWALCEYSNYSSQKAIAKAGFTLFGEGIRTAPFSLKIFGKFIIDQYKSYKRIQ
jgi:hypothetical protein